MRLSTRARAILAGLAVLTLVFAVALGSNRSLARLREPAGPPSAPPLGGDLDVAFAVAVAAGLGVLLYSMWGGHRRKRRDDDVVLIPQRPPVPGWQQALAVMVALLPVAALALVVALSVGRDAGRRLRPVLPAGPGARLGGRLGTARPAAGAPVAVHWWAWAALAGLVIAAVAILAVRRRRARRGGGRSWVARRQVLAAAVEESLAELAREPDPRRAVIRAYVGMERSLARHGVARHPAEAPGEYLARALAAMEVSGPAAQRLTSLFQRARFSGHQIAAGMKQQALAALAAIRDELDSATGAGGAAEPGGRGTPGGGGGPAGSGPGAGAVRGTGAQAGGEAR
jgi:hypothetical protein